MYSFIDLLGLLLYNPPSMDLPPPHQPDPARIDLTASLPRSPSSLHYHSQ